MEMLQEIALLGLGVLPVQSQIQHPMLLLVLLPPGMPASGPGAAAAAV